MLQIRDTMLAVTGLFLNHGNGRTKNGGTKGATEYAKQKYVNTLNLNHGVNLSSLSVFHFQPVGAAR